jgi:glutamyl-tRNA reductase
VNLLQIGFSHKDTPVAVRERLARLDPGQVLSALRSAGWPEAVALATCNRFELYLCRAHAHEDTAEVIRLLERLAGCALGDGAAIRAGEAVAAHLFSVASGLDSLVVGETEILGQVKAAYDSAFASGMTAKRLNVLFQRALYVGKRVRHGTGIASGPTSAASVAVQLAGEAFGDLSASQVLVLGAGRMAELACLHFLCRGVCGLCIINRTQQRAEALAADLRSSSGQGAAAESVRVRDWAELGSAVAGADIVLASTGSDLPVLTRGLVADVLPRRRGRPLFIIDIAMPRDVEESVQSLDGVYLYRMADLERIVCENLSSRQGEMDKARRLVQDKAGEFAAWAQSLAGGRELSLTHSCAD